jgi:hypothetical protein
VEWHYAFGSRWRQLWVPLDAATADELVLRTVRNLEFDVALTVDEFSSLMKRWTGPVYAWQCRELKAPSVSIGREKRGKGAALVETMRGLGIDLVIDSTGRGDLAMLASHERRFVVDALARVDAGRSVK